MDSKKVMSDLDAILKNERKFPSGLHVVPKEVEEPKEVETEDVDAYVKKELRTLKKEMEGHRDGLQVLIHRVASVLAFLEGEEP